MAPTTVATAARLMLERHLRWMLPVRDAAGRVPGVISPFRTCWRHNSRMRLSRGAQTAAGHLTPADASVT